MVIWSFKYSHWSLFYIYKSRKDNYSVDTKKYNLSTPGIKYIIPWSGKKNLQNSVLESLRQHNIPFADDKEVSGFPRPAEDGALYWGASTCSILSAYTDLLVLRARSNPLSPVILAWISRLFHNYKTNVKRGNLCIAKRLQVT